MQINWQYLEKEKQAWVLTDQLWLPCIYAGLRHPSPDLGSTWSFSPTNVLSFPNTLGKYLFSALWLT